MTTLRKRTEDLLAEAAMEEEGSALGASKIGTCDPFEESLEEHLVEVAFAEAADYDEIHRAILHEHLQHCKAA